MRIFRCHECGLIDAEAEGAVNVTCPQCHSSEGIERWIDFTMDDFDAFDIEKLWELFGRIALDRDGNILESFFGFEKGTNRIDIWRWFDEKYPGGVAALLYPNVEYENRDSNILLYEL